MVGNRNASGYAIAAFEPRGMNFTIQGNTITANQSFDLGLVNMTARDSTAVKGEALLRGNRYNFGTFGNSTYPSAESVGVKFGFAGTVANTNQTLIAQDEVFSTDSSTAGPSYAYYGSGTTNGFKNVFIDNATARGMGIAVHRNVEKVRITNSKIREALAYGIASFSVSSPEHSYQDWLIQGCVIDRSQLDGVRLLAPGDTRHCYTKQHNKEQRPRRGGVGVSCGGERTKVVAVRKPTGRRPDIRNRGRALDDSVYNHFL
jgi:hypothetical protein